MIYCNNATKAIVTFNDATNGKTQVEITQNLPIDVACADESRTGRYIFNLWTSGMAYPTCNPDGQYGYGGGSVIADRFDLTPTYDHPYNKDHGFNCLFYDLNFYIGDAVVSSGKITAQYRYTQRDNPDYHPGNGKFLTIKDKTGNQVLKNKVQDCNFTVNCDDGCPDGQFKCSCATYPGYCCIPCGEIKGSIQAINSVLRSMNNG